MQFESKVFTCSQGALENQLSEWLKTLSCVEVLHMAQSQSYHGEPREPSQMDKGRDYHTAASVTLTIVYKTNPFRF